jgi:hypothetical protein
MTGGVGVFIDMISEIDMSRITHVTLHLVMTQLPSNPYPVGLWRNAYNVCFDFEQRSTLQIASASTLSPLVLSRFLGYMILEAPTDHGRTNFSNEVIACTNDVALQDLAKLYMNHFLRCCECT